MVPPDRLYSAARAAGLLDSLDEAARLTAIASASQPWLHTSVFINFNPRSISDPVQFLDGTVALVRVGIRWTNAGLRIRRMYRFDFSLEGVGRRTGYIIMLGTRLEIIDDGLPEQEVDGTEGSDEPPLNDGGKVVPFRRRGR